MALGVPILKHFRVYARKTDDRRYYTYTMVCPPVRGDNPRALASGLSPVQADKPWYNYFIPPSLV